MIKSKGSKVVRGTTKGLRKAGVTGRDAANEDRVQQSDQALKKLAGTVIRNDTRPRVVRRLREIVYPPAFSKEVLRGPLPEVVYCDCNIFRPTIGDIANALCGCGERHLRLYRDDVIHWRGKHWGLACAFRFASTFVPSVVEQSAKLRSSKKVTSRRRASKPRAKRSTG